VRRVLLFAAFLLLLGLTTATAASFDVQAEDITSFSADVDIPVTQTLYMVDRYRLDPELNDKQYSEDIPEGQSLSWESAALDAGLPVAGARVEFNVYTTAGNAVASAGIYECPNVDATPIEQCFPLAVKDFQAISNGINTIELVELPGVTDQVRPGYRLRLQITSLSGTFNVQWGKEASGRVSRLVFDRS